eukprot:jgi/Tetstr1/433039/TSEL_022376.t1
MLMGKLRAKETRETKRQVSEMPAGYRGSVERVMNMYDMEMPVECTTYGEFSDILSELNIGTRDALNRALSGNRSSRTDGGGATLTMARAAAAGRHRRQVHVCSVAAAVLALALLLCHWPGLALGFFPPRDSNPAAGVDDQIVGGRYANPKRYPYMASLRDPNTRLHFCAGALIETTVILTAAHCLDDRAKPGAAVYAPLVFMGWVCDETCSDEERQLSRLETSRTVWTRLHPAWGGTTIEGGDLALLILERPMTKPLLNVRWQPELWLFRSLTFLGWGLDGSGNPADKLKIAQLPYRPNENCQAMYKEMQGMSEGFLLDDMMCAGGFGDNTCKGDSGGPLILAGETYQEDIGPDRQCCSLHPGTCNRAYHSPYTGTHSSPHPGTHSSSHPCTYTGTHSSPHPGPYTGTHSGTLSRPHPGTYTGTHSSSHPGTYTGTHSSPHPGTYTGTHPGAYSSPYSRPIPTCWAVPEPNGGVSLSLSDDSHQEVPFSAGFAFPFFGKRYESVFVGSNGYLTFGEGENKHSASASTHSRLPRISGLFTDLVPDSESSIKYLQTADTFAVIYHNMLHFGSNNERSSFWITLGRSGQVTLSYGKVAGSSTAVIGLSSGWASSSEASLLGADDVCPPQFRLPPPHGDVYRVPSARPTDLRGKSLTGPLPPSWSALTGLTILSVRNNQLTGPLPPSWSALNGLERLWTNFGVQRLLDKRANEPYEKLPHIHQTAFPEHAVMSATHRTAAELWAHRQRRARAVLTVSVYAVAAGSGLDPAVSYGPAARTRRSVAERAHGFATADWALVDNRSAVDYIVYAVTDRACNSAAGRSAVEAAAPAIDGGAMVIQLREKDIGSGEFSELAMQPCAVMSTG